MTASPERLETLATTLTATLGDYVQLEPVSHFSENGSILDVCHISYSVDRDPPHADLEVNQTALIFEASDVELPEFTLFPKKQGWLGSLKKWMNGDGLVFDDDPGFTDRYSLHGLNSEAIRVLFTPELRKHLAANPGWSIRAKGNLLILFQHQVRVPDSKIDSFRVEGEQIIQKVRNGESKLDQQGEIRQLLCPAELYRRPKRLHYRATSISHRPFQGRPAGC
ncbi:MAG: hypothetical protein VX768_03650 [Planctomycetota bacterium]|nr:hypothetical protein [Planctomycetota bacterium]